GAAYDLFTRLEFRRVLFRSEVYHAVEGEKILKNFLGNTCGCSQDWPPAHFVSDVVKELKERIGDRKVIMALSGGVDSTVAATLRSEERRVGSESRCGWSP